MLIILSVQPTVPFLEVAWLAWTEQEGERESREGLGRSKTVKPQAGSLTSSIHKCGWRKEVILSPCDLAMS